MTLFPILVRLDSLAVATRRGRTSYGLVGRLTLVSDYFEFLRISLQFMRTEDVSIECDIVTVEWDNLHFVLLRGTAFCRILSITASKLVSHSATFVDNYIVGYSAKSV